MYKLVKISLITVNLFLISSCNFGGSSSSTNNASNTIPLVVDNGFNGLANNIPFITITICKPNTSICQTIDHVLLDTGSTGLRINKSILTVNDFPAITYQGDPVFQCAQYIDSYLYGSVVIADVKIGQKTAYSVPTQIINDGDQESVPQSCSESLPYSDLTQSGAKAIIGVSINSNPDNDYTLPVYTCKDDNCEEIADPKAITTSINVNPITLFATDNNGAIVSLPNVTSSSNQSITGTITFGLNTEANNIVPSTIHRLLGNPSSPALINGTFSSLSQGSPESETITGFFDSGTNVLAINSTMLWGKWVPLPKSIATKLGIYRCKL
jgi:hypothetical protein